MSEYLTLAEVAKKLRCSERTVRNYVTTKALPASMISRRYLVSPADLDKFVAAQNKQEADNGTE